MFAGPNGSGKSTIKDGLPPKLVGVYVNADELEVTLRRDGLMPLESFGVTAGDAEARDWFKAAVWDKF